MITKYVQALEYLDLLTRKAQEKKAKENVHDVSYRIAATAPKPLFTIDLPDSLVDVAFHERKSKTMPVPKIPSTTAKTEKKVTRFASQKAMSRDHKDKYSSKRKPRKTVKIIPGAFDNILGKNDYDIKGDFYISSSQITPKPSSNAREKIEYFKLTHNGQEHVRRRVDSAKVTVGINGRPREEESSVKSGSVPSKKPEKRIPVSWEDQLSNFPEEVKTIRQKDSMGSPQPMNCCENYRILSRLPTSNLIWRKMVTPYSNSSNRWPNTKYVTSPSEHTLPSSPSFIKGPQLKADLTHRYISQALIDIKNPKMQFGMNKTRVERLTAMKNDLLPLQIRKLKAPRYHHLSTEQSERELQNQTRVKKTQLKKKHKISILPLTHTKPFPRDAQTMEEYFHITKMDTWQQHPSDENKTQKSRESLEILPARLNRQGIYHNNGVQYKSQSSSGKENRMVSTAVQTEKEELQSVTFAKPLLSLKGPGAKPTTQEKGTSVKSPPVIHFRIPYCGYCNEYEMPDGGEDHQVTGGDSQEMSKSTAAPSTSGRFPGERNQKTSFTRERPNTR